MIPPNKPRRGYIRKRKRAALTRPRDPAPDPTDLIADLGAETVLAAHILRQAVDDLKRARAGKRYAFSLSFLPPTLAQIFDSHVVTIPHRGRG